MRRDQHHREPGHPAREIELGQARRGRQPERRKRQDSDHLDAIAADRTQHAAQLEDLAQAPDGDGDVETEEGAPSRRDAVLLPHAQRDPGGEQQHDLEQQRVEPHAGDTPAARIVRPAAGLRWRPRDSGAPARGDFAGRRVARSACGPRRGASSTMRAVPATTLAIVNPFSRDGATGRRFAAVERRLRAVLGPLEVERTKGPRDAERLAREAVRAGVERLIVAGGDGTLSEVATGLLAAGLGAYARIGILPFGTGGDFVKTLGVPRDLERAIACIAEGKVRRVDAYRVTLRDDAGRDRTVYGLNITSIGISALVVTLAERSPRFVGGSGAFLLGALRAILRHRSDPVTLTVDGEIVHDGPLILAMAANGRYFGGGMLVSPRRLTATTAGSTCSRSAASRGRSCS